MGQKSGRQVDDTGLRSESLKKLAGFESVLVRTECSKAEESASVLTESFTGCTDYAESVKDGIKEFPTAHITGAF